jgi:hypothetical protein
MDGSIHPITDEGRRTSEAHNAARLAGGAGRFIAIRLSDGKAEGDPLDIYDTFSDLARHWDDKFHAPLCVSQVPMPPAEGTHWLNMMRRLAEGGFKLTDPNTPTPIPRLGPAPTGPSGGGSPLQVGGGLVLPPGLADLVRPHLVPLNRAERRRMKP